MRPMLRAAVSVAILLCAGLAALPAMAQSIFFTDTAEFAAASVVPPDGPPLKMVSLGSLSDAGRAFNNAFGFAAGNQFNTVGALVIDTAKVGGASGGVNQSGIVSPAGDQMVAIFGITGTTQQVNGTLASAIFETGRLQVVGITPGTFQQNDPTTWGFDGTVLAEYVLKGQEPVLPGTLVDLDVDSEPRSLPASQTNIVSGNIAIGADLQNTLLFEEDPPQQPVPPGSQNLLNSTSPLDLAPPEPAGATNSVLGNALVGVGFDLVNEAIFADIDEETTGLTEAVVGTAAEQAVLNAIAQFGFGQDFATFGSGTDSDFTVNLADIASTGDLVADIGGNFIPGLQAQPVLEPEPASMLAWSVIAAVGLGVVWFRRRK